MLKFTRRIQGVDVDDDQASTKTPAEGYCILQNVGQHNRYTLSLDQTQIILKVPCELHRQNIEIAISERRAHARKCGVVREFAYPVLDQVS